MIVCSNVCLHLGTWALVCWPIPSPPSGQGSRDLGTLASPQGVCLLHVPQRNSLAITRAHCRTQLHPMRRTPSNDIARASKRLGHAQQRPLYVPREGSVFCPIRWHIGRGPTLRWPWRGILPLHIVHLGLLARITCLVCKTLSALGPFVAVFATIPAVPRELRGWALRPWLPLAWCLGDDWGTVHHVDRPDHSVVHPLCPTTWDQAHWLGEGD